MNCSTPGFSVLHYLPEFAQTHVHWVSDAIQPSHPLSASSPLAFSLSQHQGIFQWVSSLHQVDKVLKLQHQSFQWIFRLEFRLFSVAAGIGSKVCSDVLLSLFWLLCCVFLECSWIKFKIYISLNCIPPLLYRSSTDVVVKLSISFPPLLSPRWLELVFSFAKVS